MTNRNFKIFVVGGFVRDMLLGNDPKDMDFVVVGATVVDLLDFGQEHDLQFKQVGADFPVFLDKDGHEWAFARRERKVRPGYHGFEVDFDPTVTLEDDLFRRDLTINAMACEVVEFGENLLFDMPPVDPFGGQEDLKNNRLRHVSEHFAEDPVRVLRLARFAARFGFDVSLGTHKLVQDMCTAGELDHLVPERVWAETEKAFSENNVALFFDTLMQTDACGIVFPNLQTWNRAKRTAMNLADTLEQRVALLVHDFDGEAAFTFCHQTLKMPKDVAKFAVAFNQLFQLVNSDDWQWTPDNTMSVFSMFDVFRNKDFLQRARETAVNLTDSPMVFEQVAALERLATEARQWGFDDLTTEQQNTLRGPAVGQAIFDLRKEVVTRALK